MSKSNYHRNLGGGPGRACKGSSQADAAVDAGRVATAAPSRTPCWKCNPDGRNAVGFMRADSPTCNNPDCALNEVY